MQEINLQLGITQGGGSQAELLRALNSHLLRHAERGQTTVLIQYIVFRLDKAVASRGIFAEEAVRLLHQAARGIPRSLNTLCDLCLLDGFAAKATSVDGALVRRVLQAHR